MMMNKYLENYVKTENIHRYETVSSTNTLAKEMALSGALHGTVVMANEQTAGRGRFNRKFYSPMGSGLYMSIVLELSKLNIKDITLLTCYTAVIAHRAIEKCQGITCGIKWVNDLYIGDRKVCGILSEGVSSKRDGIIDKVIVGIGININTKEFPDEIKDIAASITDSDKSEDTREHIAASIINSFLAEDAFCYGDRMMEEYKKWQIVLGKRVIVSSGNDKYEAVAVDIDSNGRLIVKKDDDVLENLFSGEVSIKLYTI